MNYYALNYRGRLSKYPFNVSFRISRALTVFLIFLLQLNCLFEFSGLLRECQIRPSLLAHSTWIQAGWLRIYMQFQICFPNIDTLATITFKFGVGFSDIPMLQSPFTDILKSLSSVFDFSVNVKMSSLFLFVSFFRGFPPENLENVNAHTENWSVLSFSGSFYIIHSCWKPFQRCL